MGIVLRHFAHHALFALKLGIKTERVGPFEGSCRHMYEIIRLAAGELTAPPQLSLIHI